MKTTKWFLAPLFAAFALLFAGCSNSDDISGGSSGGGNGTDGDGNEVTAVGGTADKATLVTVGNSSSHIIKTDGKHWFKFVGTGDPIILETTGDVVDTYIAIWNNLDDAKGEYSYSGRAGSDDNNGEGYNALVTLNTTSGTTYFIRITAQNNSSGTYGFDVKLPTVNGRLNAMSVTDGYSSQHTITSTGEHWFKFVGTGETVIFETESNVVTANIGIYIGDNTSPAFAEKNRISIITISGTTYYIKVTGNSGTYTFNVNNGSGDGSSPSYAIPIEIGYSFSHTIEINGKQWFSFVGTGETVIFETTGSAVDTYIAIWNNHDDAKGEYSYSGRAGSDDNSGEGYNALVTINTTSGTTYFIRVNAQSNSYGTYDFVVKTSTTNGRLNAVTISTGNSSSHNITSTGEHWFKFIGTGETVIFETESNVVNANIGIYIGDNTSPAFAEKNRISITTISGTAYYVKVTGNNGTYTFNVNNGYGDGSSPSYTIPVAVGYSSFHTIASTGKQWFSFLGTGDPVVFETTGDAVDTYIAIWNNHDDAKGEYSYSGRAGSDDNSGEGQNALVSLNTTSGTMYFIRINAQNNSSGTYGFVVRNPD